MWWDIFLRKAELRFLVYDGGLNRHINAFSLLKPHSSERKGFLRCIFVSNKESMRRENNAESLEAHIEDDGCH